MHHHFFADLKVNSAESSDCRSSSQFVLRCPSTLFEESCELQTGKSTSIPFYVLKKWLDTCSFFFNCGFSSFGRPIKAIYQ
jgi:hypothetical protein